MKKLFNIRLLRRATFLCLLLASLTTAFHAAPVSPEQSAFVGKNFLVGMGVATNEAHLHLAYTYRDSIQQPLFYVFDYATKDNAESEGFVLVAADDRCMPVIGYSSNGGFVKEKLAPATACWFNGYCYNISTGLALTSKAEPEVLEAWARWSTPQEQGLRPKASYLITSTWGQSYPYNAMCPYRNGAQSVTGCGATAMAQIIRFHGYPHNGFGSHSYNHRAIGPISADFYNSTYLYNYMPQQCNGNNTQTQRDAVALLNFHCGVALDMDYSPDGSSAYCENVPRALEYFGFFNSQYKVMPAANEYWKNLLRNEIDLRRPILYAAQSANDGGHAFICDGYNNYSQFHFNWGWDSYADGFYLLNVMTSGYIYYQEAIMNIAPSKINSHTDVIYVDATRNGDGTSWQKPVNNLEAAVSAATFMDVPVWVKEGHYNGAKASNYALTIAPNVKIYGGFAGTESSPEERDLSAHTSIIDALRQQALLLCSPSSTECIVDGFTFINGTTNISNDATGDRSVANLLYVTTKCQLSNISVQNSTAYDKPVVSAFGTSKLQNILINHCEAYNAPIFRLATSTATHNITISYCNGNNGNIALIDGNETDCILYDLDVNNCSMTNGNIVYLKHGRIQRASITNNTTTGYALTIDQNRVFSSLIAHNSGNGVRLGKEGRVVGCTIVRNDSIGITVAGEKGFLSSNIIWGNTYNTSIDTALHPTLRYNAVEGHSALRGTGNMALTGSNRGDKGPCFESPSFTHGTTTDPFDYHLTSSSPCINKGDPQRGNQAAYDLESRPRIYQDCSDMGCYERDEFSPVAIREVKNTLSLCAFPNPTTGALHLSASGYASPNTPVEIFSLSGQKVYSTSLSNAQTLDLSPLPSGIYLLRCLNTSVRIVKE